MRACKSPQSIECVVSERSSAVTPAAGRARRGSARDLLFTSRNSNFGICAQRSPRSSDPRIHVYQHCRLI
ncbi:hypothetical protein L596_028368 [Steinernema carpocapsae]|uniref:Uncharacterized protein n=1 Tax=Steinernema carpocapsae TaxID=34508 RepID=A0A4U5LY78_STECR|nr:hypothetical protein L596_028368 [Steinernema carpocapsae]